MTSIIDITPVGPITPPLETTGDRLMTLELKDGVTLQGYSFGADVSSAGELVFQTGMVGYPESITDPSYEGQILVITFPLVGNYGVPDRNLKDDIVEQLPKYFESNRIHVAGLVVAHYTDEYYSHFLANSSLGQWLKSENIPAIYGVDTRALTKHLRDSGSMLGRLCLEANNVVDKSLATSCEWQKCFEVPDWVDPNVQNLVASVSTKTPQLYLPPDEIKKQINPQTGKTLRILAIDVGMKYNQIRCFVKRGVELLVVPWDYDFTKEYYDGLFISNGPGDPSVLTELSSRLSHTLESHKTPIFGICLGHQLLARAAGASTLKLKFGNRGHNIPCTSTISGRCYITSQNHGFAVNVDTLPSGWKPLFVNANDGSNEGIYHTELPYFSVQFHPESTPGPRDTEFLFDVFINSVLEHKQSKGLLKQVEFPGGKLEDNLKMHPRVNAKKVLVLGSGGLSIGQAGEFDYSGSQAIKALKEEGIYTILINPNIATIQTSKGLADKVYFLPVNAEFVRKVILHERPDAIYVTFGGQTALSVGIEMKDEFEALGVKVLGTPIQTVITTEDRELFANALDEINEKYAKSQAASNIEEALEAVKKIGFPVIVRAAYALGGLGSGFASNEKELIDLCNVAFASSPQVLVERSMKGWKEIEYEVVRDAYDNCITVCNMENFDPLGIHTGDSIVVAPSQTLSDEDYNMLRTTAVNVIRHLGVVGECNIQYALNPFSKEYCIIEVNARLSRSSALASKATGYPLAFIAAKLGLNIPLNEVKNAVTKSTCACFEPSLDYCVVKMPRWDLKKFTRVSTLLSSSMKSVGEVMSVGRTFEEAMQKAIRSTEYSNLGFNAVDLDIDVDHELQNPSDLRIFAIANAFAKLHYSVEKVWELTRIDKWFLNKLFNLNKFGNILASYGVKEKLPATILKQAKQLGFDDRQIAKFLNSNEVAIRRLRKEHGITPFVKQIDTVAAEFPAHTNYLYLTYNASSHDLEFNDNGVMVLGSGVYRIGSSVEFDWCAVTAVRTLRKNNIKTIMVNYNPETVSTDYDEADRLYFETINLERIMDIYEVENSSGVLISMGGQTSNNIAMSLHRENVKILGTSPEMIDSAENRYKFSRMLDQIGVDQPAWKELTSIDEAESFAENVGYPVLVRPSYVLSGAAMNTVYSKDDLASYLNQAVEVSREYPVVITKYIENAKEIEMDAVARDGDLVMHVVSEHVENAGVHSGDATLIVPPQDLDPETVRRIVVATAKIGKALKITGPYNIQFIAKNNEIKVIECNVRASRSFPFISKVVGVNLIEMATKVIMGLPVVPYPTQKLPDDYVAIKVPQFSFPRLAGADPVLGVEMASTGEVAAFGHSKYEAYLKSLLATGFKLPKRNILLSIGSYKEKQEMLPSVKKLYELGFKLFATAGTADFISEHGVPVQYLEVLDEDEDEKKEYSLTQHLAQNMIDLYINLPSANRFRRPASYVSKGYRTRRMAVDYSVPLVTNVKCAKLLIEALSRHLNLDVSERDCQTSHRTVTIPGLINFATFVPNISNAVEGPAELKETTRLLLEAGFTYAQFLPLSKSQGPIVNDSHSLVVCNSVVSDSAYTDFSFLVSATANNVDDIASCAPKVNGLFLPSRELSGKVGLISEHLKNWPANKQVISDAKTADLASVLLLASLQNRSIHITGVSNKEDLALIQTVKEKQTQVTCDVNIHSLFISRDEYPEAACLPDEEDQKYFWNNLSAIDCFSVGSLPAIIATVTCNEVSTGLGIKEALPLLLSAVTDGRLTVDDIVLRLHDNPCKIFNIPDQKSEVELDLDFTFRSVKRWSPYTKGGLTGGVERVLSNEETVVLSGDLFSPEPSGKLLMASTAAAAAAVASTNDGRRFSSDIVQAPSSGNRKRFSFSNERRYSVLSSESVDELAIDEEEPPLEQKLMSSRPPKELAAPGVIQQLIRSNNPFLNRNILSVNQFKRSDFHALFAVAQELRSAVEREGVLDVMKGRLLTTIFYEPSTRTSSSFIAAMERLGGRTVNINTSASSVKKGETLQDTIRTLASYCDAIVLRHPDEMSAHIAAKYSPVPILNGGNGSREHPSQAFLDLFTIREELGTVNGITVTFMGDLKFGRPVHSLCRLLQHYQVRINLVSPKELQLPSALTKELSDAGKLGIVSNILTEEIISKSDVLYCTRVQQERFEKPEEYERLKDTYIVDNKILSHAKQNMIVMHPLPRVNEIREEVDYDHRAAYFRQMRYGLFVRMALLAMVIGVDL